MNGIDFLADTNAILYFLSGNECMRPYISCRYAYSVISEMELLSYSGITEEEEGKVHGFLERCKSIPITDEIKEKTIRLRRKYNIKLPDAIIAATAIENDLALITADTGFGKISELTTEMIVPVIKKEKE